MFYSTVKAGYRALQAPTPGRMRPEKMVSQTHRLIRPRRVIALRSKPISLATAVGMQPTLSWQSGMLSTNLALDHDDPVMPHERNTGKVRKVL